MQSVLISLIFGSLHSSAPASYLFSNCLPPKDIYTLHAARHTPPPGFHKGESYSLFSTQLKHFLERFSMALVLSSEAAPSPSSTHGCPVASRNIAQLSFLTALVTF